MANVSRINGFRPVKHTNGSPYNGQCNLYQHASGDAVALGVGDPVIMSGTGSGGVATVKQAAAGAAVLGVVVGVVNSKLDPVFGQMTGGSIALDTPQYVPASTAQYVLVCDASDVVYEVEGTNAGSAYTYLVADIGLNSDAFFAVPSSTTGQSGCSLDIGGTKAATATLQFKILGVVLRPDNEAVNSSSTAVKYLAKINNATMGGGTGATGQ